MNNNQTEVNPLLKRAMMCVEVGDFATALSCCDKILDVDPENANVYLCRLMAAHNIGDMTQLHKVSGLPELPDFKMARRLADQELAAKLDVLVEKYVEYTTEIPPIRESCVARQQMLRGLPIQQLPPELAAKVQDRIQAEQKFMAAPNKSGAARESAATAALQNEVSIFLLRSQVQSLSAGMAALIAKAGVFLSKNETRMLSERITAADSLRNTQEVDVQMLTEEVRSCTDAFSAAKKALLIRLAMIPVLLLLFIIAIAVWTIYICIYL